MSIAECILVLFLFFGLLAWAAYVGYINGYKEGQTDVLAGKIKYNLIEFPDGTRDYYKESELKNLLPGYKIIENRQP